MRACQVCANIDGNQTHQVREMMFGTRQEFEYLECGSCGCLQLVDVPQDLSPFYPDDYYSFHSNGKDKSGFIKKILRAQKNSYYLNGKNILGRIIASKTAMPVHFTWLKPTGVNSNSSILDVGCGLGSFLLTLQRSGFTSLRGADPFIQSEIDYGNGLVIWKKSLNEIDEKFDLIIFNHSFEHMPDPLNVLKEIHRHLNPNSYALIRIPIAASYAWQTYKTNWVQLDAPRHLFIHTVNSMKILAEQANLKLTEIFYDSNSLQFVGSEMYAHDIPLKDQSTQTLIDAEKIAEYERMSADLNQKCEGDQAGFYLQKL